MVLKTERCSFSGLRVYPGHGTRLTKIDSVRYMICVYEEGCRVSSSMEAFASFAQTRVAMVAMMMMMMRATTTTTTSGATMMGRCAREGARVIRARVAFAAMGWRCTRGVTARARAGGDRAGGVGLGL